MTAKKAGRREHTIPQAPSFHRQNLRQNDQKKEKKQNETLGF
jgi:hypothetical protein